MLDNRFWEGYDTNRYFAIVMAFVCSCTVEELRWIKSLDNNGMINFLQKHHPGAMRDVMHKEVSLSQDMIEKLISNPSLVNVISANTRLPHLGSKWHFAELAIDYQLGSIASSLYSSSNGRFVDTIDKVAQLETVKKLPMKPCNQYEYINGWLCFLDENGTAVNLCNFYIVAESYTMHKFRDENDIVKIQISICGTGFGGEALEVTTKDLEGLDVKIRSKFPTVRFDTKVSSLKRKLADYLATLLKNIPCIPCYHYCGWILKENKYVYMDDSYRDCQSGKSIKINSALSPQEAFKSAMIFLEIAVDKTKILVFLLTLVMIRTTEKCWKSIREKIILF